VSWPLVLVVAGAALAVVCAVAMLRLPDPCDRVHVVTPVTSLAAPLLLVGLALHDGTVHGVAKYLLAALVLAVTGPAVGSATVRAARTRARRAAGPHSGSEQPQGDSLP